MKHVLPLLLLTSSPLVAQAPFSPSPLKGESYLADMKQRLAINQRDWDPFGLPQDLRQPVVRRPQDVNESPALSEIAGKLKITALKAHDFILVGPRELREGETFRVRDGENLYRLRILTIEHRSVHLQDVASGERTVVTPALEKELDLDQDDLPLIEGIGEDPPITL